jgi:hypothetical protein
MADGALTADKTATRGGRKPSPRDNLTRVVLLSILFLVPCFWQSRIQAGDLSSHVYNVWLASLISQGKVHGLWIAPQSTNVLFDLELEWLARHVGLGAAQRIAVSVAVLIFVWGAIAFIFAAAGRNWWFATPCVAMLAYGFVYEIGFFNFYLSMGICLWYMAIFWDGSWRRRIAIMPLLALAWLAHPFPVLWAAGTAAYIAIAQRLKPRHRLLLFGLGLLTLVATNYILTRRYQCRWSWKQVFFITGANQVVIYGSKYAFILAGLLFIWFVLLRKRVKDRGLTELILSVPGQLWLLNAAGVLLIPSAVNFPNYGLPFTYITDRVSLAVALMGCAVLGSVPMRMHEKIALAALAIVFFSFLFVDTRELNRLEDGIDAAVRQLPTGQRVIGSFPGWSTRVVPLQHDLDRACIGRCFSYANYEPSSRQFRIRAQAGNQVVLDNYPDVEAVEEGRYVVKPRDLPLYEVFLCGPERHDVCLSSLEAGKVIQR